MIRQANLYFFEIEMTIRVFNIVLSSLAGLILLIPFCLVWLLVRLTSPGPAIHWSKRIGQNNKIFLMPKFRTMMIETPQMATHLLDGRNYLTPVGGFLRKSSLDEIPQLLTVLKGDMSLVGPRPALFNQDDLVALRTKHGVHTLLPGVTGWAQVNGRDELSIPEKVKFDAEYFQRQSLAFDIKIILMTAAKVLLRKGISH
jgi:O-antigen biosynthesis protein WbqP